MKKKIIRNYKVNLPGPWRVAVSMQIERSPKPKTKVFKSKLKSAKKITKKKRVSVWQKTSRYLNTQKQRFTTFMRAQLKRIPRIPLLSKEELIFHMPTLLILVGAAGIVYFGIQVKSVDSLSPKQTSISIPAPTPKPKIPTAEVKGMGPSVPNYLKVNRVGIDVPIRSVGQNADGSMEVPPLFEHVTGWYRLGPTPGEIGPAVIAGHVDTYKGPSVFYKLREMQPGDIIDITREDGKVVQFKVDSLQTFSQSSFPTDAVYGNIDYAGLRLITCGGTFNRQTGHYSENTVVFATMINPST